MDYSKRIAELEKELAEVRNAAAEAAKNEKIKNESDNAISEGVELLLNGLGFYYDEKTLDMVFKYILDPTIIVKALKNAAWATKLTQDVNTEGIENIVKSIFNSFDLDKETEDSNFKNIIFKFINE